MHRITIPSQEKFTIRMDAYQASTLKLCDWSIRALTYPSSNRLPYSEVSEVIIPKEECTYVDDNTYDFILDTASLKAGFLEFDLRINVFDSSSSDGRRLLIKTIKTPFLIIKR